VQNVGAKFLCKMLVQNFVQNVGAKFLATPGLLHMPSRHGFLSSLLGLHREVRKENLTNVSHQIFGHSSR
jgi:hypothetical protein